MELEKSNNSLKMSLSITFMLADLLQAVVRCGRCVYIDAAPGSSGDSLRETHGDDP